MDFSRSAKNRVEANYNNNREAVVSRKYDGPSACEGCKTFACYHGECNKYQEDGE